MNKVILIGRLTRDPDVRWSTRQDGTQTVSARFTLAVDRRVKTEGGQAADFVGCVAFGKIAEFADKYLRQGIKIVVEGRIQTGSYTNREGQKVYTTDVVVEAAEFSESKSANEGRREAAGQQAAGQTGQRDADGFMRIPDDVDDAGLPFN